jgi:hypothetical protein
LLLHLRLTPLVAKIGDEGTTELSEVLKSNTSLTSLSLNCNIRLHTSFSLNTGNDIGDEEAIKLSEALKSNSTLTELDLGSKRLVTSF